MLEEDDYRQAVDMGRKNLRTLGLIRNWCAHVRIEQFGGGGLIAQHTRLPIGTYSLACDHADLAGVATWDLADAALDFHDRYCRSCPHHAPVGLPSLAQLVLERDALQRAENDRQDQAAQAANIEAEHRRRVRLQIRSSLDPVAATVLDQIGELDAERSQEAADKLVASARVAPDAFTAAVVEHLFAQIEMGETWLYVAGLGVLDALKAAGPRLAACAMKALAERVAVDAAAQVMQSHLSHLVDGDIAPALAALVELARPTRSLFTDEKDPLPSPLIALHAVRGAAVEAAVEAAAETQSETQLGLAVRAILVLADSDPAISRRFARSMISKLARCHWLEGRHEERETLQDLRQAVALAYWRDPEVTEDLMAKFLVGATEQGQARIFSVYRHIIDRSGRRAPAISGPARRLAIKRVIWAGTTILNDPVRHEIGEVLRRPTDEVRTLARELVDDLIGASVLVHDLLEKLDAEPRPPAGGKLEALQRSTQRMSLANIRNRLIEWAVAGAAGDVGQTRRYVELLGQLPEEREGLRAALVSNLQDLVADPETLTVVLPALYGALVGPSVRIRAAGATVMSELKARDRGNAPDLLIEAFVALLQDPYLMVVRSAVRAMGRRRVPEAFRPKVRDALMNYIEAYGSAARAENSDAMSFLEVCLKTLIDRYLDEDEFTGVVGAWLVKQLHNLPISDINDELRFWAAPFAKVPEFGQLVVKALSETGAVSYGDDDLVKLLRELPLATIRANADDLSRVVQSMGPYDSWARLGSIVEALTAAGAWDQAEAALVATIANFPDTRREARRRTFLLTLLAAVRCERALAEGRADEFPTLAATWREADRDSAAASAQE